MSTLAGDAFLCYLGGSSAYEIGTTTSVGPYTLQQDGPSVQNISCTDVWNQTAVASITLDVVPPTGPPADTFTSAANGNGTWTFTWSTYGSDGCYVEQFNTQGVEQTLVPGGNVSGTAVSGFLSPAYEPYNFILYCGGVPANVPVIVVSP